MFHCQVLIPVITFISWTDATPVRLKVQPSWWRSYLSCPSHDESRRVGNHHDVSGRWEGSRGVSSPFTHEPFLNPDLFPQSQMVSFHAFNSSQSCTLTANFHLLDIFVTARFSTGIPTCTSPCPYRDPAPHCQSAQSQQSLQLCIPHHHPHTELLKWILFFSLNPLFSRSGPHEDNLYVSPIIPLTWGGLSSKSKTFSPTGEPYTWWSETSLGKLCLQIIYLRRSTLYTKDCVKNTMLILEVKHTKTHLRRVLILPKKSVSFHPLAGFSVIGE